MNEMTREIRQESIAQMRRYSGLCLKKALSRGSGWSGYGELLDAAINYQVQADRMEAEETSTQHVARVEGG